MPRVRLSDTGVGEDGRAGEGSPSVEPSASSGQLQLFGVLGRGGMGVVLRAHDPDLGRDLAVKVLREPLHDQPDMVRRFVEEAQIGGQLQHPGIVPVYELGSLADRRPYIAMRLVKGRTLAELLAARAGPADGLPGLVGIFESVCQTMAYAHARGVIHRDLKPSNIMVGSFGEVQVMDWGLAKVLAGDEPHGGAAGRPDGEEAKVATGRSAVAVDVSRPGSVLGTPAYMAPEQARGEVDALDERADVFALGSILCEILTGQAAFTGEDWAEIEGRAARGEVAEAMGRLSASGAEGGLTGLAADCLAAGASSRPRDARAVAMRVTAYRAGVQERLRAAELARVEAQARAVGELRRRRLAVALAAAVVGLLVVGGGGAAWVLYQRQAWRSRVAVALKEAEVLRDQALDDPTGDLGRWQAARAAVRRLHDLRDVGHSRAVGERIDGLGAQVEREARAAEADRRLLDRLEEVRAGMVAEDKADAAFAEAFAQAGYDLGGPSGDPEVLGRLLAGRPRRGAWPPPRRWIPGPSSAATSTGCGPRAPIRTAPAASWPPPAPPTPNPGATPCATPWPPATPTRSCGWPTTPSSSRGGPSASGCSGTAWR